MSDHDKGDIGIGDVAQRTGVTERTLRYYEELGLLAPGRDAGGRRRYDVAPSTGSTGCVCCASWERRWPRSTRTSTTSVS